MKNLMLLTAMLFAFKGLSQTKTIQGTVLYEETKKPVPFAYVKLKDVAYGTVTDFDGTFSLKIPSKYFDSILEFSYVGLKSYEFELHSYSKPIQVFMETEVTELYTVVVSAKRDQNPKSILKKALRAIPDNYVNEDFNLNGFYREYVMENDNPVKYADAAFMLDLKPYTGKEEKKKKFENPVDLSGVTTIGSWTSRSSSLHRWHFHQSVLKGEKAKIIEAKSSEDLNTTRLYSHIQGGPLSALTKDRLKYPKNFLTNLGKYEYTLLEVEKDNEPFYLINFVPAITVEKLKKKNRYYNFEYKLGGSILIRKEDMAITEINYSVPPEFKQFICGYRGWSVRHFDFSVESKYAKKGDKYVLEYLKHADEFIVEDTASDRRVPYAAISEFFTHEVKTADKVSVAKADNFSNSDYNYLFDLPEGFNTEFWAKYSINYPESKVPDFIRVPMSKETSLEKQFSDKLKRDTTLTPPIARRQPQILQIHGQKLEDNYAWLKDTKNPLGNEEVMKYLSEENGYTNNYFKPLKPLQRQLFKEVRSYIQDSYESLPTEEGGYTYY
ncbi:MAG: carboxypeptidase-like regulatory domain-containing protein, partial [Ekhidna sp.]|nr:carboxypeptidase-like regulatory domain-containing protein [Ekhidna sp.]